MARADRGTTLPPRRIDFSDYRGPTPSRPHSKPRWRRMDARSRGSSAMKSAVASSRGGTCAATGDFPGARRINPPSADRLAVSSDCPLEVRIRAAPATARRVPSDAATSPTESTCQPAARRGETVGATRDRAQHAAARGAPHRTAPAALTRSIPARGFGPRPRHRHRPRCAAPDWSVYQRRAPVSTARSPSRGRGDA